jgi:hypothetical protein
MPSGAVSGIVALEQASGWSLHRCLVSEVCYGIERSIHSAPSKNQGSMRQ